VTRPDTSLEEMTARLMRLVGQWRRDIRALEQTVFEPVALPPGGAGRRRGPLPRTPAATPTAVTGHRGGGTRVGRSPGSARSTRDNQPGGVDHP